MSLNNRKISTKDQTQDLGGFCFSLKTCQQSSHWKGGCPEAILKEGKRGEKECGITQELDLKISDNRSDSIEVIACLMCVLCVCVHV